MRRGKPIDVLLYSLVMLVGITMGSFNVMVSGLAYTRLPLYSLQTLFTSLSLQDVESSRSYLDELFSTQQDKCQGAMVYLKNAVIGSNKQKSSVISQGIVPRLVALMKDESCDLNLRRDSAIVIASLAQGNEVQALIDAGLVTDLLQAIAVPNVDPRLVEICLKGLRYIYQHSFAPSSQLHRNSVLVHLIGLASVDSSLEVQASVANILQSNCHSYMEQMALFRAGAVPLLARLMTSPHLSIKRPSLKCLAGLCFTNRPVSDSVCTTSFDNETVPDILTCLTSRARPVEIQLTAARCLTYLHRSGSLEAVDPRIEFKALPCLVRLCTADFDEEIRATAAETLAYLAEVVALLQLRLVSGVLTRATHLLSLADRLQLAALGRD